MYLKLVSLMRRDDGYEYWYALSDVGEVLAIIRDGYVLSVKPLKPVLGEPGTGRR